MKKTIGMVAKQSGCSIETIRFYERIGLLDKPKRNDSGHRIYSSENLAQLNFVKHTRDLGFSLDEVAELQRLAQTQNNQCTKVKALANEHLTNLRHKIKQLQLMERELSKLYDRCDESIGRCEMLAALSE